jgi:hypothetical protein
VVARIVAQMQGIANIGQVYDRRRLMMDKETFQSLAIATIGGEDKARVWLVHLGRMEDEFADASGSLRWERAAIIEGILQIEDANDSESTAIALAETITKTLAADLQATKLGGTVLSGRPPRLEENEPRFFVFVFAHYLKIVFPLITIEQ